VDVRALRELESVFKALGNINRLKLLLALQTPRGYSEIELTPSRGGQAGSSDRPISRQAVRNHVQELQDIGVVVEAESDGRRRRFVVDRARLFAVVERMRRLATVEPSQIPAGQTIEMDSEPRGHVPDGPHLALVRGVEEGRTFQLDTGEERHVIGREKDADVVLDYDGFVSGEHATVHRKDDGFFLRDLPRNKNGTFLNWRRLQEGGVAPLAPGDVVGVGRSLLVFRE
jgi:DNA-binding transcriptional ArsR family regulator